MAPKQTVFALESARAVRRKGHALSFRPFALALLAVVCFALEADIAPTRQHCAPPFHIRIAAGRFDVSPMSGESR